MAIPRSGRVLLFTIFLFILVTYSSFRFGDSESRLPDFQSHGSQPKQDPALEFRAVPGGLKDVRNATLGVCDGARD